MIVLRRLKMLEMQQSKPFNTKDFIKDFETKYPNIKITAENVKRELVRYKDMVYRCYKQTHKDFKYYGKRGIKVCREWLDDKALFIEFCLKNHSYLDDMTIDRINSDDDYKPKNCQIITRAKNCTERPRINGDMPKFRFYHQYGGLYEFQYAIKKGFHKGTLKERRQAGWTDYEILFIPRKMSRLKYWQKIDKGLLKPHLEVFENSFSQNALNFFDDKILKCPKCKRKSLTFNKDIGAICEQCNFIVKIRSI